MKIEWLRKTIADFDPYFVAPIAEKHVINANENYLNVLTIPGVKEELITALDIRDFQCRYRNLQRLSQYTEQIVFGRSCTGFILRDADVGGFYRKAHSYPQSSLRHPTFQTKATDAFSRTHKAVHCLCSLLRAGWPAFF